MARTTSQFLVEFGVQLAVNGDFYRVVNGRADVTGLAASDGVVYSKPAPNEPTLYISKDRRAGFRRPSGPVYSAISGNPMLLKAGRPVRDLGGEPDPRTVVAVDRGGRRLILIVVDGRQSGYSEGATPADLAEIALRHGAYEALSLDGGGSSAMVAQGADGLSFLLSRPVDKHIPGRERTVGNHLGIYAERLENGPRGRGE